MVDTPFFGPFSVTRSTNLADNTLINLRPEVVDTKDGKNIGALYGTPGLTLLGTTGSGPIQNGGMRVLANTALYVVSGTAVYVVNTSFVATVLGTILNSLDNVSMVDNGTQMAIFTADAGYVGPVGFPLTGGNISSGGANYAINDTVVMSGLFQTAAVILTITNVVAGAVTAFTISQTGAFNPIPGILTQQSTTGSGSGFALNTLTFGGSLALCKIFLPFTPSGAQTISGTYSDGFGLINEPPTQRIWQSAVDDLSVWPALNFATASGESDEVQTLQTIHREVFVIKQKSTEVWNNAGTTGFAFQALGAVMIEQGTSSWPSVVKLGESLVWLAQSSQGGGTVVQIDGFQARRVSTHAIETLITGVTNLADAFGYGYVQDGHQLYVLTFPSDALTLVYDKTDSAALGVPVWYQWLGFISGAFTRHTSNAFSYFQEKLVVGDYQNGNLYQINLSALTDNGQTIKRVRSWRALVKPTMQPIRFSSLAFWMQTGLGVVTIDPQIVLDWSDDGGHSWSAERYAPVGNNGQTAQRVLFTRIGSTRRNSGQDRILRVSMTDQFPVCIIGAELYV